MNEIYRLLTQEEIITLKKQNCTATDWNHIKVAPHFTTDYISNVLVFPEISIWVNFPNRSIWTEDSANIPWHILCDTAQLSYREQCINRKHTELYCQLHHR